VEKYCRTRQAAEDNTAHAYCIQDVKHYRNTLQISNIYWFSTAAMIARTRLSVTLHVHCLSSLFHDTISNSQHMASNDRIVGE